MAKLLIDKSEHLRHPWVVHRLLPDFQIEDAWRIPVILEKDHSLEFFHGQFLEATKGLTQKGLPGILFSIRFFIGSIFGWDKESEEKELLRPGSLRKRYAEQAQLDSEQLIPPGKGDFSAVYLLENEALGEIENKTVHAGMHFGRVGELSGKYGIQMTIYVKPKGLLGRIYMKLIKPFRLWIVYPAIMRAVKHQWEHK